MHRVTANAVADRPAETSAGAYSCLHVRRCYATLRWASVRECPPSARLAARRYRSCAMAFPREISDDLFILCDTLIEGGEDGVESAKDLQVGTDSRRSRVPDASLAA